ncbi:hypothetical protein OP10G_1429 [Fimbriimonas ginsengisoli Gsoil 348]|uniref:Uncharacterized protein n=1 Tax=Fimbriimonas ginsengisoli Gsoil 348 TaxID=661478 RepID=A0A068NN18_FIMGI|nr:hypothetical protein OP10G_1429 [Fimbriimonas ginsengisoli Gsoil 348]
MAGDADGDGRADLIAVGPGDDSNIEVSHTDPLGKPNPSGRVHDSIGKGLVACAAGNFIRVPPAKDVLTIFADGTLRLASQGIPDGKLYQRIEEVGKIDPRDIPEAPLKVAVADFDGDFHTDVMLLGKDGRLLLLYNRPLNLKLATSPGNPPRFVAKPLKTTLPGVRQLAAGNFKDVKVGDKGQLAYLDSSGNVWLAAVAKDALAPPRLLGTHSPDDHLVAGRFRGRPFSDILVGRRLYTSGVATDFVDLTELPDTEAAKSDGTWDVADIDGNGKDDLIRHHEGRERWGAQDIYIHFSYDKTDAAKGFLCSANDGLPDFWKMGRVNPGGLDLKALGCKVGHRDVVVEIERFEDVDLGGLQQQMNRVAQYFASIPLKNPDGTTGIAIHFIYPTPWPNKDHNVVMGDFDGHFPRHEHRGIVHTMFAENGGPLVSAINGDRGHFNGHWQEFIHEFGHQLDLAHDGFYGSPSYNSDTGCALYPSLMSYTYSYGLDGSGENVRYSDGARASLVLNEEHLDEILPFPIATVHFLSEGPYRFKIKPGPDGKTTLVDWNWNGIFGEKDVHGDLNYTHGTDPGPLFPVGRATSAPAVALHGDRPILVYAQDGGIVVRTWTGSNRPGEANRWSDELADQSAGVTGDPTVAYIKGITYVVYPTAKGTVLRAVTMEDPRRPLLHEPNLLPRTAGAQPTVLAVDNRLVLLLWRGKALPVDIAYFNLASSGITMGDIHSLALRSEAPVGAVTGSTGGDGTDVWIGRIQGDGPDHGGLTEIVRYRLPDSGSERLISRQWVAGVYARRRMTLLWSPEPGFSPDGRIYLIGSGVAPGGELKEQYITMQVPYADMGGWLIRRYEQPSYRSPSATGACFFHDNILYALRYGNDELHLSFYGNGCTPWPTGDFDDLGHIRDWGLSHSIREIPK